MEKIPPKYSKKSLHEEFVHLQTEEDFKINRSTFIDILEKDCPHIRVSRRQRGLCDICFVFRDSVKALPEKDVPAKVAELKVHLDFAETTRLAYKDSLKYAQNVPRVMPPIQMESATVSYDYAKQLSIPLLATQTMNERFSQKKGYDVNLFGIVDKGDGQKGMQYNYVYGEGTKHGSIQVTSMLHHFFSVTSPSIGKARRLFLPSDSCIGQNKNNILLGYFMLRVAHGYNDKIIWQFMAVGHTKFRPDEGFGNIRRFVDGRVDILSMKEMMKAIENSSLSNKCVLFPVQSVQDWKEVSSTFNSLYGIRKFFAYKIHIRATVVDGKRSVVVDVHHKPNSGTPDMTVNLLKKGKEFPKFESFKFVQPQPLTLARRKGLFKDVYSTLRDNRVSMTNEAHNWWKNEVIGVPFAE